MNTVHFICGVYKMVPLNKNERSRQKGKGKRRNESQDSGCSQKAVS